MTVAERILVVDDEDVIRNNIVEFLRGRGYLTEGANNAEAALEAMEQANYALILADIHMPGMDGIELLERVVNTRPKTFVFIMTAYASVDSAVDALRHGAYDYIIKPVVFEDLAQRIENLVKYRALREEVSRLRRDVSKRLGFEGVIGESPVMRDVFVLVEKVAPTNATVLVTGDSGTGKELVARAIHARSAVSEREFLAINMAALPREMIEAQLFGHEKGAFTGAETQREGLLRSVRGGTIFLDEIGELPMVAQAKLLRAVEMQEILPVGADRPEPVDFRLIAATNRDLIERVRDGAFREDLYYRLNVFQINVPRLVDRREDIPELVSHFVTRHAQALGRGAITISNAAMKRLLDYGWPGNVRELSNVIERACILAGGDEVDVEHLPTEIADLSERPVGLKMAVEQFEKQHIAWVLRATSGNREQAARMLQIDPATLYRRLSKYEMERE